MKKLLLFLICIPFLWSCKETDPSPQEALVANKDWQTDGIYVAGNKIEATPYIKVRFSKSTINTTVLNGQNLGPAATWSVANNILTISYPNISNTSSITFTSQSLKITKSTENELWLAPVDANGVQLFGIINLTGDAEFRLTLNPNSIAPNITDANLTAVTWKGSGSADAGYFLNNVKQGDANVTLAFRTFYGINYVTISGVPTPATWALNTNKTRLILSYPRLNNNAGGVVSFNIVAMTSTSLILKGDANSINILGGIINIPLNQELRLIP
jgi:hypothetical protein